MTDPQTTTPSAVLPHVMEQLEALPIVRGRPLLVVDADEVLVLLAAHLKRFLAENGVDLRLTEYRLEGALYANGAPHPLSFEEAISLLDKFFKTETLKQKALPGAREALERLSDDAQIVILTNIPAFGREARIANLKGLGIPYPLVQNHGGKGAALAWLHNAVRAPTIFIDDSPHQIQSAARYAPEVARIHFAGAELVAHVMPECAEAHHRVNDWRECERVVRCVLDA